MSAHTKGPAFKPWESETAFLQDKKRRNDAIKADRIAELTKALELIAEGDQVPGHCNYITKARMAEIARVVLAGPPCGGSAARES